MGRGPSYPYVDLEGAIVYARKIYDYAKRGSAPTEAVIKDGLKLSVTSSGSQKIIAALRAFGLVEDTPGTNGKALKLTPRAIRILLDDQDSAERQEEIRKAALSPKWYDYCWSKWGKEMPPAMRSNLLIEHGFVDSTVDSFLDDYRKTIAFAGLLDSVIFGEKNKSTTESKDGLKIGDYVQWERPGGVLGLREAKRLSHFSENKDFGFVEGEKTGIPVQELIPAEEPEHRSGAIPQSLNPALTPLVHEGLKMMTDVISLRGEMTLQLQWPNAISQEAYDDLVDQLELLKKRAKRAVKEASASEQQGPE